jgi:hypothetical protein
MNFSRYSIVVLLLLSLFSCRRLIVGAFAPFPQRGIFQEQEIGASSNQFPVFNSPYDTA